MDTSSVDRDKVVAGASSATKGQGITITASAADEIRKQAAKRGTPTSALRIGIKGGGCTGFSYLFEWSDGEPKPKDRVFERDGVKVYIDPKSLVYLDGTELDFVRGMMGHGFKFNNPNAKGACGCGESVQF
jgi:iron-sulfur cluster assembly protein